MGFELSIENENLAAWMSINNSFTFDWARAPEGAAYWHGVLIQLGRFLGVNQERVLDGFSVIDFCDASGKALLTLDPTSFHEKQIVWINVVGATTDSALAPAPLERVRHDLKIGQQMNPGFDPPGSLHRYLQPYPGAITLWHEKGYSVRTEIWNDDGLPRARQVFTFDDGADAASRLRVEVLSLRREGEDSTPSWRELVKTDFVPVGTTAASGSPTTERRYVGQWELLAGGTRDEQEKRRRQLGPGPQAEVWNRVRKIAIRQALVEGQSHGGKDIHKNPPQRP